MAYPDETCDLCGKTAEHCDCVECPYCASGDQREPGGGHRHRIEAEGAFYTVDVGVPHIA